MPLLQLALDYLSLPPALAMACLVRDAVDVIEVGTPLCKAEGMGAVRAIRALCPQHIILADLKTLDTGALEASMAFDAGADWLTVSGSAPLVTVQEALREASARNKEVLIELTGVADDVLARSQEWRALGAERVVYHRGWDEGNVGQRQWTAQDCHLISRLAEMGYKVSVAGNITPELLPLFKGVPVAVFVVGRAIRGAPDPLAAAQQLRALLAEWP